MGITQTPVMRFLGVIWRARDGSALHTLIGCEIITIVTQQSEFMTHQWVSGDPRVLLIIPKLQSGSLFPATRVLSVSTMNVFQLDTPLFWAIFLNESLSFLLPSLKRAQWGRLSQCAQVH